MALDGLAVLRVLVDRLRSLGTDHTRIIAKLHQMLLDHQSAGKDLHLARSHRGEVAHDLLGLVVIGVEVQCALHASPREVGMPVHLMSPPCHRPSSG